MTKATIPKTIDNLSYFFSEGALDVLRLGGSDGLDGGVGISASDLDSSALVDVGFEDSSFWGCESTIRNLNLSNSDLCLNAN